jgi:hypothetical protein
MLSDIDDYETENWNWPKLENGSRMKATSIPNLKIRTGIESYSSNIKSPKTESHILKNWTGTHNLLCWWYELMKWNWKLSNIDGYETENWNWPKLETCGSRMKTKNIPNLKIGTGIESYTSTIERPKIGSQIVHKCQM